MAKLVRRRNIQWIGFSTDDNFPEYAVMYTIKYVDHRLPNFEFVNAYQKIKEYPAHRAEMIIAEPRQKKILDRATGIRYALYRGNAMFNILLPQDAAR